MQDDIAITGDRADYYAHIREKHMAPLWESLHDLVPRQPASRCVPALWKYDDIRSNVMASGGFVGAEDATRRVFILENPGLPDQASVTQSLYAGVQLVLPGETAPSHRHTQSAIRFIIEGTSAYMAVNGERAFTQPGDFVITPPWSWHDHGNVEADEGGEPVVWLDGMDIPMVRFLDAGFAEDHPNSTQPVVRSDGDSVVRYGYNMLPVRYKPSHAAASPIVNYPYERSREALDRLYRQGELDAWDGVKLRYVNPATGGYPLPTIAAFMQLLPAGFQGKAICSTDSAVYCVVEGRGNVRIGNREFGFEPHDVFVAPSWQPVELAALEDATLFSYSDRPAQAALGLWREDRLA